MDLEWEDWDGQGGLMTQIGAYDLVVEPQGFPSDDWRWYVEVGETVAEDGYAPTKQEAQAAAINYVRSEVAELARAFGLIDQEWISVDERLPDASGRYLILAVPSSVGWQGHHVTAASYAYIDQDDRGWIADYLVDLPGLYMQITHWRPLPPPDDEEVTT